ELPNWYVHTWDRTSDGERSFRLDRMRSATLTKKHFEPRDGFEPTKLRNARTAQILYAKDVARFAAERGARRLTDGTALAERPYGDGGGRRGGTRGAGAAGAAAGRPAPGPGTAGGARAPGRDPGGGRPRPPPYPADLPDCSSHASITASSIASPSPRSRSATTIM